MIIEDIEALKIWLESTVSPLSDAEPPILARYVLALLKKKLYDDDLKKLCLRELEVFLKDNTMDFVTKLFSTLKTGSYNPKANDIKLDESSHLNTMSKDNMKLTISSHNPAIKENISITVTNLIKKPASPIRKIEDNLQSDNIGNANLVKADKDKNFSGSFKLQHSSHFEEKQKEDKLEKERKVKNSQILASENFMGLKVKNENLFERDVFAAKNLFKLKDEDIEFDSKKEEIKPKEIKSRFAAERDRDNENREGKTREENRDLRNKLSSKRQDNDDYYSSKQKSRKHSNRDNRRERENRKRTRSRDKSPEHRRRHRESPRANRRSSRERYDKTHNSNVDDRWKRMHNNNNSDVGNINNNLKGRLGGKADKNRSPSQDKYSTGFRSAKYFRSNSRSPSKTRNEHSRSRSNIRIERLRSSSIRRRIRNSRSKTPTQQDGSKDREIKDVKDSVKDNKKSFDGSVSSDDAIIDDDDYRIKVPIDVLIKSDQQKRKDRNLTVSKTNFDQKINVKPRCRDFDEKGFCLQGNLCKFDHGKDPVVIDQRNLPKVLNSYPAASSLPEELQRTLNSSGGNESKLNSIIDSSSSGHMHFPPPQHIQTNRLPTPIMLQGPPPQLHFSGQFDMPRQLLIHPANQQTMLHGQPMASSIHNQLLGPQHRTSLMHMLPPHLRLLPPHQMPPHPMSSICYIPTVVHNISTVQSSQQFNALKDLVVVGTNQSSRQVISTFDSNRIGPSTKLASIKSRLGIKPGNGNSGDNRLEQEGSSKSKCTLEIKNIPTNLNNIASINQQFAKFGSIVNIQVNCKGNENCALVTFSNYQQANAAYSSSEPVFNNRFIQVDWHYPNGSDVFSNNNSSLEESNVSTIGQEKKDVEVMNNASDQFNYVINNSTNQMKQVILPEVRKSIKERLNGNESSNQNVGEQKVTLTSEKPLISQDLETDSNVITSEGQDLPKKNDANNIVRKVLIINKNKPLFTTIARDVASGKGSHTIKTNKFSTYASLHKFDQTKELMKRKLEMCKSKQILLKEKIEEQKNLLKKLLDPTLMPADKNNILTKVNQLKEESEKLKIDLEGVSKMMKLQTTNPKADLILPSASKSEIEKSILDAELDLIAKTNEGADTTDLDRKVTIMKLQADILMRRRPSLTVRKGLPPPVYPLRGARHHIGRYPIAHKVALRSTKISMRNSAYAKLTVDRRTRKMKVTGFKTGEKNIVLSYLQQLGKIESYEDGQDASSLIITFVTRQMAEKVSKLASKAKSGLPQLTFFWYVDNNNNNKADKPVMSSSSENIKPTRSFVSIKPFSSTNMKYSMGLLNNKLNPSDCVAKSTAISGNKKLPSPQYNNNNNFNSFKVLKNGQINLIRDQSEKVNGLQSITASSLTENSLSSTGKPSIASRLGGLMGRKGVKDRLGLQGVNRSSLVVKDRSEEKRLSENYEERLIGRDFEEVGFEEGDYEKGLVEDKNYGIELGGGNFERGFVMGGNYEKGLLGENYGGELVDKNFEERMVTGNYEEGLVMGGSYEGDLVGGNYEEGLDDSDGDDDVMIELVIQDDETNHLLSHSIDNDANNEYKNENKEARQDKHY